MNYHTLLNRAIELAIIHHKGQLDKGCQPYFNHCFRVMQAMKTDEEKIVAILHDAIEDTSLTINDLRRENFPIPIITALNALTRKKGQSYKTYIYQIMNNPLAIKVKIADLTDNINLSRINHPTQADYNRQIKYIKYRKILLNTIEE